MGFSQKQGGFRAIVASRRLANRVLSESSIALVGLLFFLSTGSAHAQETAALPGTTVDAATPEPLTGTTGVTLNQDFTRRIPLFAPSGRGAAARSFESLAALAPGAHEDTYGVSINGTTSPENAFRIDGVSVNNPAYGILGTPLSIEFVQELDVITGGYLPEYGRAMGGVYDVTTRSGSNEFHGSVFFNLSPGGLEGPRTKLPSTGSVITTTTRLGDHRDFGAQLGGPIVKDKLWFYGGIQAAFTRDALDRSLSAFQFDPVTGEPLVDPATNSSVMKPIPGGARTYYSDQQTIQYIGKLTYLINRDHHLTLSVIGTPTTSGGNGSYGYDNTGAPELTNIVGSYEALGHEYIAGASDVSLKYQGAFNNGKQLLDLSFGWHHQRTATLASDGSKIGDKTGLSSIPEVIYRRSGSPGVHRLKDFEAAGNSASCNPSAVKVANPDYDPSQPETPDTNPGQITIVGESCPVTSYARGGAGFLDDASLDSYQGRAVFTNLVRLAGHHVIKAGLDVQLSSYSHVKAYSGANVLRESASGALYEDYRAYGFLQGPDDPVLLTSYTNHSSSTSIGGFVQDTWSIMDVVTLNAGIRYDAQLMYGSNGVLGLSLANQWSPRIGAIYDFNTQGRWKLFASYAVYHEGVPLDLADRALPDEPRISSLHRAASSANPGGCDPFVHPGSDGCTKDAQRRSLDNATNNPNLLWSSSGGGNIPVDPETSAQSSGEVILGGDYAIFPDARVGIIYTRQFLFRALEDMSRDEGRTLFLGNPGFGHAVDFPRATRDYTAVTAFFQKSFSRGWLGQASYTLSRLHGNYAGLFRPEDGQLDPNITSEFDARSGLSNTTGLLPADRTHAIKLYGARDFILPGGVSLLLGAAFRTRSGTPLNYLGVNPEIFLLPRGAGGRNDWTHDVDLRLGGAISLSKSSTASISVDVFNLFNFQGVTSREQIFAYGPVSKNPDGTLDSMGGQNPSFGKPTSFQAPRQFRLGARMTF